jgi:hypothetical protein
MLMRRPLVVALTAALFPWSAERWSEEGQAAEESRDWEIFMQKRHERLPMVMEIGRRLEEAGGNLSGGIRFEGDRVVVRIAERAGNGRWNGSLAIVDQAGAADQP